ncbi:MAG: hypothetical protein KGN30_12150, partial [Nitrospirota bacterium]|nr:hypothetical protein [Nitrospirota bacterium]
MFLLREGYRRDSIIVHIFRRKSRSPAQFTIRLSVGAKNEGTYFARQASVNGGALLSGGLRGAQPGAQPDASGESEAVGRGYGDAGTEHLIVVG